jgi:hypothetical protein
MSMDVEGGHVMVYVTRDDSMSSLLSLNPRRLQCLADIRKTPDALQSLVYGVEDHMSYRTAFWPIYMN